MLETQIKDLKMDLKTEQKKLEKSAKAAENAQGALEKEQASADSVKGQAAGISLIETSTIETTKLRAAEEMEIQKVTLTCNPLSTLLPSPARVTHPLLRASLSGSRRDRATRSRHRRNRDQRDRDHEDQYREDGDQAGDLNL